MAVRFSVTLSFFSCLYILYLWCCNTSKPQLAYYHTSHGFGQDLVEISFVALIHVTYLLHVGLCFCCFPLQDHILGGSYDKSIAIAYQLLHPYHLTPCKNINVILQLFYFSFFFLSVFLIFFEFLIDKIYWLLQLCNLFNAFNLNCVYFNLCLVLILQFLL